MQRASLSNHRPLRFERLEDRRLLAAYNLLVATFDDSAGSSVLEYSEATNLRLSGGAYTGDQGLGEAQGIAVAPDGSYYVSSAASGNVLHFSSAGGYLGVLGAGDAVQAPIYYPGTLAFGPNGNLYVADLASNAIYQFNVNDTTQQYVASATLSLGFTPGGFAFAQDGTNDLIVGDLGNQSVVRFHDGKSSTLIAAGSGINPAAILPLSNGNLLIADLDLGNDPTGHHQIVEYNGTTETTSQFIDLTTPVGTGSSAGLPPQPTSLLLDSDGNLLVGLSPDHNGNGAVMKFNITTGAYMETIASSIGTPSGLALAPAAPSDILFSTVDSTNGASVLRYNDTSELPVPGGAATGTGGLGYAEGVAVAPDGSYYVSSGATAEVLHFSNSGQFLGDLGSGDAKPVTFENPGTLAFGPDGNLYVADIGAGAIYQFDTSSATQQFQTADTLVLPSGFSPGGFAFAPDATHDLIVGDLDSGAVVRFHDGTSTTLVPGGSILPFAILALSNGNLLIADGDLGSDPTAHHEIVEYDAATGTTSQFIDLTTPVGTGAAAGLPPQPTSLAFDADGNLLVGLSPDETGDGAIEKFNITTGAFMTTIASGLGAPSGVALIPSQTSDLLAGILTSASQNALVLRYSTAGQELVAGGASISGTETSGVAVAPDGSYYVATLAGQVLHYSNSGVYLDSVGTGGSYFYSPGTMAFGPDGNLYVEDLGYGVIYQFNVNSPANPVAVQQLPAVQTPQGPATFTPAGFTFAFNSTRDLIVGDYNSGEVVQCNADGSFTTLVAPNYTAPINPLALLALSNGSVLIADAYGHQILEYSPAVGDTPASVAQIIDLTTPAGTGPYVGDSPQPTSLLLDPNGDLIIGLSADEGYTDGAVQTYDLSTGALISTQISSIAPPAGLAYIPPVEMTVAANDWTAAGLTITETSDGMLHIYTTGTTTDVVPPEAAALVGGIEIVGADSAVNALTIDYSGGDPIPPDGISFDGGLGTATNSATIDDTAAIGTLSLSTSQLNLANVPSIAFNVGSGAFDVSDLGQSAGGITSSSGSFAVASGTVNANLNGPGGLAKTGSGTATLSGTNTFQGGTIVSSGTLIATSAAALPDGSTLMVGSDTAAFAAAALPSSTAFSVAPAAAPVETAPIAVTTFESLVAAAPLPVTTSSTTASLGPADPQSAASTVIVAPISTPASAKIAAESQPSAAAWVRTAYNNAAAVQKSHAAAFAAWQNSAESSSYFQDATANDRRIAALDAVLAEFAAD